MLLHVSGVDYSPGKLLLTKVFLVPLALLESSIEANFCTMRSSEATFISLDLSLVDPSFLLILATSIY